MILDMGVFANISVTGTGYLDKNKGGKKQRLMFIVVLQQWLQRYFLLDSAF
jgi:hypothetical protein